MREDEEEVEKAKISEPVKTVDDLLLQDELNKLQEVRFLFAIFFQTLIKILFYKLNLILFFKREISYGFVSNLGNHNLY